MDAVNPDESKPQPSGSPEVWSNGRAALCNAVESYFNSHQGSQYACKGKLYGLLIDKYACHRDMVKSQIIITNVGGGRKLDSTTGQMARTQNQDDACSQLKVLRAALNNRDVIVVISGSQYPYFPVVIPHTYNVLDHFIITDLWPEKDGKNISHWKIRLEKFDLQSVSWWTPHGEEDREQFNAGQYICEAQMCPTCETESKIIFQQGWICLNNKCEEFFRCESGADVDKLTYDEKFVNERSHRVGPLEPVPLVPALPNAEGGDFGTEKKFKMGMVCPKCRCCSRRMHWKGWECENPDCDFTHTVQLREVPAANAVKEEQQGKRIKASSYNEKLVGRWDLKIAGYDVEAYSFPGKDGQVVGSVFVYRATSDIRSKVNGPDDLYRAMQKEDLRLKRNPARNPGARVEQLTNHFSSNWGAFYKFGVLVETNGFAEAPEPILRGQAQLDWAHKETISAMKELFEAEEIEYCEDSMTLEPHTFNELLSLGYFESCVINYHDDGEKELGPTVATLSLGSPSIMNFAPKSSSGIGKKTKGKYGPAVLSFPLNHGDIVVMHGSMIHKHYVHSVKPAGKLRFALTCRYIRPETIHDPKARAEAIEKGKIPEGIEQLAYKGTDEPGQNLNLDDNSRGNDQ
ncbi:uncharacterized protein BCR38DRAFT_338511 [Pseudomassariella vexata]|uniref:Fe2OG dioxygenase domain-containing protein n=1 Tax=Pseudomassariella vexata TaxID=1141098 RepID=A0A1Y2E9W5_9PEZI|nr:uncharacterized protein BCR38DRAFT_338511 [Pseudomassariella vexata]ORY67655.1 hypothetical protein BCR38DRAFT_338511 [Pseudomassariella vexata]